jgi:hypothetical protein
MFMKGIVPPNSEARVVLTSVDETVGSCESSFEIA